MFCTIVCQDVPEGTVLYDQLFTTHDKMYQDVTWTPVKTTVIRQVNVVLDNNIFTDDRGAFKGTVNLGPIVTCKELYIQHSVRESESLIDACMCQAALTGDFELYNRLNTVVGTVDNSKYMGMAFNKGHIAWINNASQFSYSPGVFLKEVNDDRCMDAIEFLGQNMEKLPIRCLTSPSLEKFENLVKIKNLGFLDRVNLNLITHKVLANLTGDESMTDITEIFGEYAVAEWIANLSSVLSWEKLEILKKIGFSVKVTNLVLVDILKKKNPKLSDYLNWYPHADEHSLTLDQVIGIFNVEQFTEYHIYIAKWLKRYKLLTSANIDSVLKKYGEATLVKIFTLFEQCGYNIDIVRTCGRGPMSDWTYRYAGMIRISAGTFMPDEDQICRLDFSSAVEQFIKLAAKYPSNVHIYEYAKTVLLEIQAQFEINIRNHITHALKANLDLANDVEYQKISQEYAVNSTKFRESDCLWQSQF